MPAVQFKDYYKTLKVPRDADEKALRAAFRKLARKHHPDINPNDKGAEERFKEINEAYEVLSDPDKRKLYDRYGEEWQRYKEAGFTGDEPPFSTGRPRQTEDFGSWFTGQPGTTYERTDLGGDGSGFSDFFETLFGAAGRRRGGETFTATSRPRRGEDIEADVTVTFDEAFRGTTRTFEVQTADTCPICNGSGLVRGGECPTCDGSGVVPKRKAIEVKVPAGVATGSRIRVAGQGGVGQAGGPSGDVYLRITVEPDPRWERDGADLKADVDVPLYTALLGGEVEVATPTGRVALRIPPETQGGRLFRLRGQGMPRLRGGERGDLLARANIVLPTRLTDRERELVGELRDLRGGRSA